MKLFIGTGITLLLVQASIEDLRTKRINIYLLALHAITAILVLCLWGNPSQLLFSFLPGGVLLLCARASRRKIGYGDGLLFLTLGCYLDVWNIISLLFFSLILSSFFGMVLMLVRRVRKDYVFPFVPFVFGAWCLFGLLELAI